MEEIKPITNQGFFSYVFMLSKFKQADLLNFVQYSAVSILPFILLYYYIKKYTPNTTYKNGTLYITLVTFFSIMAFIIGIFFIDRIVNFIPTLSGKYYDVINLTNISIVLIMVLLISPAGYAERINILLYRFDNWFKLDDYIVKLFGVKDKPTTGVGAFNMYDHEQNQWLYEVAFTKTLNAAKASGADDTKATATGHLVADKLKKIKDMNEDTDAQRILASSPATKQNMSSATTLNPIISQQYSTPAPLPIQGPTQPHSANNMYANTQNPFQNIAPSSMSTTNPYAMAGGGGGGGGGGMMDSGDPEPANGALGSSGFSTW